MLSVQNSFAQFEAHIIATLQHGWQQFNQVVSTQADNTRSLYGDMTGTVRQTASRWQDLATLTLYRFSVYLPTSSGTVL